MRYACTVAAIRAAEAEVVARVGEGVLMQRAATALAGVLQRELREGEVQVAFLEVRGGLERALQHLERQLGLAHGDADQRLIRGGARLARVACEDVFGLVPDAHHVALGQQLARQRDSCFEIVGVLLELRAQLLLGR